MSSKGVEVRLTHVSKRYGDVAAVDDVSLDVPAGNFLTLLGSSGSGKTTTLNLIAGFAEADGGDIAFDGVSVARIPPHRRQIGMVFQSYALFPHMTVAENVRFPLRMRSTMTAEQSRRRIGEVLELVRLTGFEKRLPRELSGGQQQRVAMARALVSKPRLLLMDEPLGALDRKLREHMQIEIRQIHAEIGATFVYVTHDQTEALTMSDQVAIMSHGKVVQIGRPDDLYDRPVNAFVADFLGGSNLIKGRLVDLAGGEATIRLGDGTSVRSRPGVSVPAAGADAVLLVRPEAIEIAQAGTASMPDTIERTGRVETVAYLGEAFRVGVRSGSDIIWVRSPRRGPQVSAGQDVVLRWSRDDSLVLDPPRA